jgi:hypothetical protein
MSSDVTVSAGDADADKEGETGEAEEEADAADIVFQLGVALWLTDAEMTFTWLWLVLGITDWDGVASCDPECPTSWDWLAVLVDVGVSKVFIDAAVCDCDAPAEHVSEALAERDALAVGVIACDKLIHAVNVVSVLLVGLWVGECDCSCAMLCDELIVSYGDTAIGLEVTCWDGVCVAVRFIEDVFVKVDNSDCEAFW